MDSTVVPVTEAPAEPKMPGRIDTASSLLKQAAAIYKKHVWSLLGIILLPALVAVIATVLFVSSALFTSKALLIIVGAIVGIIAVYVLLWGVAALVTAVAAYANGQTMTVRDAYVQARGRVGAVFVTILLMELGVIGGLILLIIPGIIFIVFWSQSGQIAILEGISWTKALKKSWAYVRGHWWGVFWRMIAIGLIGFGINVVLSIVAVVTLGSNATTNPVVVAISDIVSIFWTLFTICYYYCMYRTLKKTYEIAQSA